MKKIISTFSLLCFLLFPVKASEFYWDPTDDCENAQSITAPSLKDLLRNEILETIKKESREKKYDFLAKSLTYFKGDHRLLDEYTLQRALSTIEKPLCVPFLPYLLEAELVGLNYNVLSLSLQELPNCLKLRNLKIDIGKVINTNLFARGVQSIQYKRKLIHLQEGVEFENIGTLSNLTSLSLPDYSLENRVTFVSTLTALTELDLRNNWIGEHVTALEPLSNLRILNLDNNKLAEETSILSTLTNLEEFHLRHNPLKNHLTFLPHLRKLRVLNLFSCHIESSVTDLSSLTNLRYLNIGSNGPHGSEVTSLSSLTNLETLHIHSNQLGRLSLFLSHLTNLRELKEHPVQLFQSISHLTTLTKLETLDVAYNNLTGSTDVFLGFTSLTDLNIQGHNYDEAELGLLEASLTPLKHLGL